MPVRKFKAKIVAMGETGSWACIRLPFDAEKAFGSRGRVAVKGTVNDFAFRSAIFPDGSGSHFMMVNKAMCDGAKCAIGDTVAVTMEPDTVARTVTVPTDLKAALAKDKAAAALFGKLAYSHKKEYVDWITAAKRPETRADRVAKALRMLVEKKPIKV